MEYTAPLAAGKRFWRMFEQKQGRVTAVPGRSGNDPGRKWFRGSRMRNAAACFPARTSK